MKTGKILVILITALVLMLFQTPAIATTPMGTAFTYQGRLIDTNKQADGLYDFQFSLYDANTAGNKVGSDVNTPGTDVVDGYFTVLLDFGSVFNGNALWLELAVRPGGSGGSYTTLNPRQQVTAGPSALSVSNLSVSGVNTFIGYHAGYNNTGNYNTFSGVNAGRNNTGNYNTFTGYQAGSSNTTGTNNTFSGFQTGFSNTTGNYNTFTGDHAGHSNTTGSGNVFIGFNAGYSETGSNKLYIANTFPGALIYGDFSANTLGIGTTTIQAGHAIDTWTGAYLTTGGAWTNNSSRDVKENITPVDARQVLEKLVSVPVSTWNYKVEDQCNRHMGPMAQDFYAAFGLNDNDTSIATIDADGISLAAIQGLYQIVKEKDSDIAALTKENESMKKQNESMKKENEEIKARLSAVEELTTKLNVGQKGVAQ